MNVMIKKYVLLGVVSFTLSACGYNLHSASEVNQNRVEITKSKSEQFYSLSLLGDRNLRLIAGDYYGHGENGVDITMLYNPKSKHMKSMEAMRAGAQISKKLRIFGVNDVRVSILPVSVYDENQSVIVSYDRYSAGKPKDCKSMAGFGGVGINVTKEDRNRGYKYGCEIENLISKQIARPKDLLGNDKMSPANGRRLSNMYDSYIDSSPNEQLSGETATE